MNNVLLFKSFQEAEEEGGYINPNPIPPEAPPPYHPDPGSPSHNYGTTDPIPPSYEQAQVPAGQYKIPVDNTTYSMYRVLGIGIYLS